MARKKKQQDSNNGIVRYKMSGGDYAFEIVNYIVFALFTLLCFFPFYYLFINTISSEEAVTKGIVNWYPIGVQFTNYTKIFKANDFLQSLRISVVRTILGTSLMVLASAFVGYLVTKQEIFALKIVYRIFVITMYFNAGIIPWYTTMQMLGLTNNFWGYIIPGIVAPYNIILVKTYVESIPAELEESAHMDGASYMQVFTSIILPLSKPILATIAIFGAVGNWNSFQDCMILMRGNSSLYTLQYLLYQYLNEANNLAAVMTSSTDASAMKNLTTLSNRTVEYTVSMASIIPILLVYPFMMRYFEKGIMIGAVKG